MASVRLSVCPVGILTATHQGAACKAASVHLGPIIRRTDVLVQFMSEVKLKLKQSPEMRIALDICCSSLKRSCVVRYNEESDSFTGHAHV